MNKEIFFPNLNIYLTEVGRSFEIFGFEVAYYGIIIGLAMLSGVLLAVSEAKRTKQSTDTYFDLAIVVMISAIVGARFFYVLFSWESYKNNLLSIFNLREGGLAVYGGIILSVSMAIVFAKVKKLKPLQLLDTGVLGLGIGQMIGRWGNFFNREVFGEYTNSLFAMGLPLSEVRESDVTELMRADFVIRDGVNYILVHPTFLYESLWCLGLLVILLVLRKYKKYHGEMFLLYISGYGIGRAWFEEIRTDKLFIGGTNIPVSQLIAVISALGLILFVVMRIRLRKVVASVEETIEEE